jgi:hypothetical protein
MWKQETKKKATISVGGRIVNYNLASLKSFSYIILSSQKYEKRRWSQKLRCIISAYNASCPVMPFAVLDVRAEYRGLGYNAAIYRI